jgi:nicotinamidase-related amidase
MVSDDRFHLSRDTVVFVVIDFQDRLLVAIDREISRNVTKNIQLLIYLAKIIKIPLIVTEQYTRGLGLTKQVLIETLGDSYQPVEKLSFSCYRHQAFLEKLNDFDVKHLVLVGLEMHVCVLQTALDLLSAGYTVSVVSDAVCSRYKSDWQTGLKIAGQAGAVVSSTEIIIFQLLGEAGTAEFKLMVPLLKQR